MTIQDDLAGKLTKAAIRGTARASWVSSRDVHAMPREGRHAAVLPGARGDAYNARRREMRAMGRECK